MAFNIDILLLDLKYQHSSGVSRESRITALEQQLLLLIKQALTAEQWPQLFELTNKTIKQYSINHREIYISDIIITLPTIDANALMRDGAIYFNQKLLPHLKKSLLNSLETLFAKGAARPYSQRSTAITPIWQDLQSLLCSGSGPLSFQGVTNAEQNQAAMALPLLLKCLNGSVEYCHTFKRSLLQPNVYGRVFRWLSITGTLNDSQVNDLLLLLFPECTLLARFIGSWQGSKSLSIKKQKLKKHIELLFFKGTTQAKHNNVKPCDTIKNNSSHQRLSAVDLGLVLGLKIHAIEPSAEIDPHRYQKCLDQFHKVLLLGQTATWLHACEGWLNTVLYQGLRTADISALETLIERATGSTLIENNQYLQPATILKRPMSRVDVIAKPYIYSDRRRLNASKILLSLLQPFITATAGCGNIWQTLRTIIDFLSIQEHLLPLDIVLSLKKCLLPLVEQQDKALTDAQYLSTTAVNVCRVLNGFDATQNRASQELISSQQIADFKQLSECSWLPASFIKPLTQQLNYLKSTRPISNSLTIESIDIATQEPTSSGDRASAQQNNIQPQDRLHKQLLAWAELLPHLVGDQVGSINEWLAAERNELKAGLLPALKLFYTDNKIKFTGLNAALSKAGAKDVREQSPSQHHEKPQVGTLVFMLASCAMPLNLRNLLQRWLAEGDQLSLEYLQQQLQRELAKISDLSVKPSPVLHCTGAVSSVASEAQAQPPANEKSLASPSKGYALCFKQEHDLLAALVQSIKQLLNALHLTAAYKVSLLHIIDTIIPAAMPNRVDLLALVNQLLLFVRNWQLQLPIESNHAVQQTVTTLQTLQKQLQTMTLPTHQSTLKHTSLNNTHWWLPLIEAELSEINNDLPTYRLKHCVQWLSATAITFSDYGAQAKERLIQPTIAKAQGNIKAVSSELNCLIVNTVEKPVTTSSLGSQKSQTASDFNEADKVRWAQAIITSCELITKLSAVVSNYDNTLKKSLNHWCRQLLPLLGHTVHEQKLALQLKRLSALATLAQWPCDSKQQLKSITMQLLADAVRWIDTLRQTQNSKRSSIDSPREQSLLGEQLLDSINENVQGNTLQQLQRLSWQPNLETAQQQLNDYSHNVVQSTPSALTSSNHKLTEQRLKNTTLLQPCNIQPVYQQLKQYAQALSDQQHTKDSMVLTFDGGLVLLWPYLTRYFQKYDLLIMMPTHDAHDESVATHWQFVDEAAQLKAHALLMNVLAVSADDNNAIVANILVGLEPDAWIESPAVLTAQEINSGEQLLIAVITNWPALKNMPVGSFRELFLWREASCTLTDGSHHITIESKTVDILLTQLPWGLGYISLPWLGKQLIQISWQYGY